MSKTRIEAFTDAVIAIIMTILVLELKTPAEPTWQAFWGMSHKLIIYVVSFFSLAIYWNNHHHMFQLVHKVNGRVLWANNFFIFTLSLFPLATAWVGDELYEWPPQAIYGVVVLLADIAYYIVARELVREGGKDSAIGKMFQKYFKLYVSIGANLVALAAGYLINPLLVLIINVAVLLMWFIPEKRVEEIYRKK